MIFGRDEGGIGWAPGGQRMHEAVA